MSVQDKPPIGLKPRGEHERARCLEIIEAMKRYVEAGKEIPIEWLKELLGYDYFKKQLPPVPPKYIEEEPWMPPYTITCELPGASVRYGH